MCVFRKKSLPFATGSYVPSCVDLMTEYLPEKGIFIRLYYPSAASKRLEQKNYWGFPWVPHDKYVEGIACVVGLWVFLIRLVIWWYGGETYIPALWEANLLPKSERRNKKLPVIIFSHGFGATRFFCSSMLIELASHGYVVAALEHRDRTAAATYYYKSPADRDRDERTWIPHIRLQIGAQHYELRNEQLKYRRDECIKTLDLLQEINSGNISQNNLSLSMNLQDFEDQLDLDQVTVMGHSFGGATALLALASDQRFKQGVILDGWMFPLKGEPLTVLQPLLFINSPTFHIPSNLTVMERFITNPPGATRQLFVIKTSTHETQTDSPFVLGYWLDLFKPKIDPHLGTSINNKLVLRFLHSNTGIPGEVAKIQEELDNHNQLIVEGSLPAPVSPRKGFTLFS